MTSAVSDDLLEGRTPAQSAAIRAIEGPVVILAGAGSGKTTTITRRIANQVRAGDLKPESILAVTFTTKAAGELKQRLEALKVAGVQARTFHSAALRQVQLLGGVNVDVLEAKSRILMRIRDKLPNQYRTRAVGDLGTEISLAKTQRLTPETYLEGRDRGSPPVPPEMMRDIFDAYEREKDRLRCLDYEDILEYAIRIFETDERAVRRFRSACAAITVDEYQDVNLLQQTLLDWWLGDRDDVCIVGDDYQAIFGFAGASPKYLIGMRDRFAHGTVVTLETNFRSSPQVLETANRLAPHLGGIAKQLSAHNGDGPEPVLTRYPTADAEVDAVVDQVAALIKSGTPAGEIAILYRANARSTVFEMALASADIPAQVARGGFLERQAAKGMIARLGRGAHTTDVADTIERLADEAGLIHDPDEDDLGRQEYTRQIDLQFLVTLGRDFDDGSKATGEFVVHLRERFGSWEDGETRDAVRLSTIHLAKGLEWDAVFLPSLADGELPIKQAINQGTTAEERRLFYVALTRPRWHLRMSYSGMQQPSRFLDEIAEPPEPTSTPTRRAPTQPTANGQTRTRNTKPDGRPVRALSDAEARAVLAQLRAGAPPAVRGKNRRTHKSWTADEDALLVHLQQKGRTMARIAQFLERSQTSVATRLAQLGHS
jgi:DNA helicase-2/ATP-dependent DNA helicase PcrA